jgi:hypothetical protein
MKRFLTVGALALVTALGVVAVPAVSSASASTTKSCGNGISAGKNTSCQLAKRLFRKIGRDAENIADGRRVGVRSPVTGRSYAFFLYRADGRSFTCRAYGDGVLSVRIAT